jgi:hypothetical protein
MSNRTDSEMREFKMEMRQEFLEESRHEQLMYSDEEYAIEQYESEVLRAVEMLRDVSSKLSSYGHELSINDLVYLY